MLLFTVFYLFSLSVDSLGKHSLTHRRLHRRYRLEKSDQFMQQNFNTSTFRKNEELGPLDTLTANATSLHETWKAVGSPSRRGSLVTPPISSNNRNYKNSNTNTNSIDNTTPFDNQSPALSPTPNSLPLPAVRRSSFDQSQWGALRGFQWEGPGIFDNETTRKLSFSTHSPQNIQQQLPSTLPPPPPPPSVPVNDTTSYDTHHRYPSNDNNNILSVPMLPNISIEPVYRQQRSLSFSVGQDPTFFGFDDYEDSSGTNISNNNNNNSNDNNNHQGPISFSYKHLLSTMEEEDQYDDDDDDDDDDDENDTVQRMFDQETNDGAAQWRARSKSSGAALGILSSTQRAILNQQLRRGSEQYDSLVQQQQQQRRSSRFFGDMQQPTTSISPPMNTLHATTGQPGYPQMSIGDKEHLNLLHRRLSQSHGDEYKFPDQSYNVLHQQGQSLNEPTPSHHYYLQQLSDQFKNVSLHGDFDNNVSRVTLSDTFEQQSRMSNSSHPLRQQPFQQQQQQQQQQKYQQSTNLTALDTFHSSDNKGIPLQQLPQNATLYSVEFKGGRPDYFYVLPDPTMPTIVVRFHLGDLVIVEGDRGNDLGKVASGVLNVDKIKLLFGSREPQHYQNDGSNNDHGGGGGNDDKPKDMYVKRLYRMATSDEIDLLLEKGQDEMQALALCQQKVKLRNLPMSVVDAEYQWDRRKLTFFFVSNRRIDFRELVRELFKIYKTRIWMRAVNTNTTALTSGIISSIEL